MEQRLRGPEVKDGVLSFLDLSRCRYHPNMSEFNTITWTDHNNPLAPIDCAIILTLEGSERTTRAVNDARLFSELVSSVAIQTNPGYKHCEKPLPLQTAEADCAFSHYAACKYSLEQGFDTVLVLEDDYRVEPEYAKYRDKIGRDIAEFLVRWRVDHYFLGCTPFFAIPWGSACGGSWRVIKGGTAHALIHSRNGMEKIVKEWETDARKTVPIDLYMFSNHRSFMHSVPLVSQTFPNTENKIENWGSNQTLRGMVTNWFLVAMELDRRTQPGYNVMYAFSKTVPILIIILVLLGIVMISRSRDELFTKKRGKKQTSSHGE